LKCDNFTGIELRNGVYLKINREFGFKNFTFRRVLLRLLLTIDHLPSAVIFVIETVNFRHRFVSVAAKVNIMSYRLSACTCYVFCLLK
ncbi:unnamed protein product, partial [Tenebrio molitor]